MLLVRAPVRISFAGGGTDFPVYYEQHGGLVVSTTIDKYFYVMIEADGERQLQITSADYSVFYRHAADEDVPWEDGQLRLPRAVLNHFGIRQGLSMFLASEIPGGTGLGSSSTVAVALVKAMGALCGLSLTPGAVAEIASYIELVKLGSPIGKQDQYAAAHGGFHAYRFGAGGVAEEPILLPLDTRVALEQRLCMFYTGGSREANKILKDQRAGAAAGLNVAGLHAIKAMAEQARRYLSAGKLGDLADLLHAGWLEKRRLAAGISNARIDELYDLARQRGARGGKLAGAGGGGFLLLYCEPAAQPGLTEALEGAGLRRLDFRFSDAGASVLLNTGLQLRQLSRRDMEDILATA